MVAAKASQPILLHQLLAAPIAELVRAEAIAATAFVDVVRSIGFTSAPTAEMPGQAEQSPVLFGTLRMVSFQYSKQGADGSIVQMTMEVPLLSLIPLPIPVVQQAMFDFDVNMSTIASPTNSTDVLEPGDAQVQVTLSPVQTGKGAAAGNLMHVQLTVQKSDLPGGILNLLQTVNSDVVLHGEEQKEPVDKRGAGSP